jgi:hypothetical protein
MSKPTSPFVSLQAREFALRDLAEQVSQLRAALAASPLEDAAKHDISTATVYTLTETIRRQQISVRGQMAEAVAGMCPSTGKRLTQRQARELVERYAGGSWSVGAVGKAELIQDWGKTAAGVFAEQGRRVKDSDCRCYSLTLVDTGVVTALLKDRNLASLIVAVGPGVVGLVAWSTQNCRASGGGEVFGSRRSFAAWLAA